MYSETALGGGSTTQFEKFLGQNVWKICSFPKLKLSEHHPFSKKLDLPSLRLSNFSHNNPTQPHLGKPRPVQVHNHQISNHHPKWRALKIPVLDHISISKRWRRCHQRHCLRKKKHVFSLGKPKYPTFRQLFKKTGGCGKKSFLPKKWKPCNQPLLKKSL